MKKGQSTLDYVLLIGVFAAALIAMLVYVSRGLQGNLRANADRLGVNQYDYGNTSANNNETKKIGSTKSVSSTTTVTYGNLSEPNPDLEAALQAYKDSLDKIDEFNKKIDSAVVPEAKAEAKDMIEGGTNEIYWEPWPSSDSDGDGAVYSDLNTKLGEEQTNAQNLYDTYLELQEAWDNREITDDSSSSSGSSSETNSTDISRTTSESLGDL